MANFKLQLEVCANGIESAIAAQEAGVARIELCEHLEVGGVTPDLMILPQATEKIHLPIHVLIRPRAGNFFYSKDEFNRMKTTVMLCKSLMIGGVVFGVINEDNAIDTIRCGQLTELARPMSITFHRAFDEVRNPFQALEEIISLGFDRILTSGQKSNCLEGSELISQLVEQAAGRISIMAGAGITEENIAEVVKRTYANEFHFTAKKKLADGSFVSDLNRILKIKEIAEKTYYDRSNI